MSRDRVVTFKSTVEEMPWVIRAGEAVELDGGGTTTILTYRGISEITGWTVNMSGDTFEMVTTGLTKIKLRFTGFSQEKAQVWADNAKEMTAVLQRLTLYSVKIEALAKRRREFDLETDDLMDEIEELSSDEDRRYRRRRIVKGKA